ncbi:EAL domain-containing protein [Imbroritus primus]|uniref:EAL domain-containing protein n=1 Tax=Imbroritus primus TaxID=3058603 RepID=A0ACD3SNJ9_9BURK|nr:EAL domain-containing protein [Burkholderiaceae bacterium PBA]
MERHLTPRDRHLRAAEELVGIGSWYWDLRTQQGTWSNGMFKLFGLKPVAKAPSTDELAGMLTPQSFGRARKMLELLVARGIPADVEIEVIHPDGDHRWLQLRADIERDANGEPVAVLGAAQDVTAQRQSNEQLRLLRRVIQSAACGIVVADALQEDLPLVYVNPAFEAMTGYRADEVLGRNCRFLHSTESGQAALNEVRAALREQRETRVLLRNFRKDGQLFLNQFLLSPVRNAEGKVTHYVGIQEDVTEREMARQRVAEHTMTDPLTSLPNRYLLMDRVSQAIGVSAAAQQRFYFALFNIDRFKVINESLGHVGGDKVLRRIAERLTKMVGPADTVARFGADVFALIISHTTIARNGFDLDLFDTPLMVDDTDVFVTTSIGIAEYPTHGHDFETLFRHAEIAMYQAKSSGGNRVEFFRPEMDVGVSHRLNLEHEIREALAAQQFRLLYQPQIDAVTGRICGVEALIRWLHPTRGVLPPAAFIPMAEESGLIVDIGNWVLEEAARQRAAWREIGVEDDVVICVNASPLQFRRGTVLPTLLRLKREYGFDSGFLEIEVTESMLMDSAGRMIEDLMAIRQLGVKLSIDDFGTGYSSLAYLKRLPIDMIKIDRAFVNDVTTDPNDAVICTTIIALAHNLGVKVCAEGVEGQEQSDFLRQQQCDVLQGYHFSAPVLPDVVTDMFTSGRRFQT